MLGEALGPREAILGRGGRLRPASGELRRPGRDVPPCKYGITEAVRDFVSRSASSCCTPTAPPDPPAVLERRSRLAEAATASGRVRLATAEQIGDAQALERVFEQAVAEG